MFSLLAFIYTVAVLPPLIYLLVISLAGILKPRRHKKLTPVKGSIGVLIPAHNEEQNIQRTLKSIQAAANVDDDISIHVIADNCTDNTADLAREMSIDVLERYNDDLRGKGAALQWATAKVTDKAYDFTVIIDADSIVSVNFFTSMRKILSLPNCEVVQARYEAMSNEHSSIKRLAMLGFNVLRARGRVLLGGSAGIMGNGFMLSRAALKQVPFQGNSIVEDLEYHTRLVEAGMRVRYCNSAKIYGEMPTDNAASDVQSSRWEGGRIGVLKQCWKSLAKQIIPDLKQGKLHSLDALLDLLVLPIGYVVMILFAGLLFPYTQGTAVFGFFVIGIYVLGAAACGEGLSELTVLRKLPDFLWRKICRIPALLSASEGNSAWKRTPRDKE